MCGILSCPEKTTVKDSQFKLNLRKDYFVGLKQNAEMCLFF